MLYIPLFAFYFVQYAAYIQFALLYNSIYAVFIDYTSTFMHYFEIFLEYVAGRDLPTYIIWMILGALLLVAGVNTMLVVASIATLLTVFYNENKEWFDTEGVRLFWYYYGIIDELVNVTIPYYIDLVLYWTGEVFLLINDTETFLKKYGIIPEKK